MSNDSMTEPCFNCARDWHHACNLKDCRKCHGSEFIDAGKPTPEPARQTILEVVPEPTEPEPVAGGDPFLRTFAQQLMISFRVNAFLCGQKADPAVPVNCPEHGWVTTPLITCNKCQNVYPVVAFAMAEQKPATGPTENEALTFCGCGLRYYHARCPLCEKQVVDAEQNDETAEG